jgi:hypothetical protein
MRMLLATSGGRKAAERKRRRVTSGTWVSENTNIQIGPPLPPEKPEVHQSVQRKEKN